jgi:hypothetical protein
MSNFTPLVVTAMLAAKPPQPGDWSFGWAGVASIAEMALAIVVCLWMIARYFSAHQERSSKSPWRLFFDLCSAHKLSRRERNLLKQLASLHRLEQPAMLFVEPSCYSVEKLGPKWVRREEELDGLRQRLFAAH